MVKSETPQRAVPSHSGQVGCGERAKHLEKRVEEKVNEMGQYGN